MPAGSRRGAALLSTLMACGFNVAFLLILNQPVFYQSLQRQRLRLLATKVYGLFTASPWMPLNHRGRARKFVYSTAILLTLCDGYIECRID